MRAKWISLILGLIVAPALALAEPQFTAQDIIDHFSKDLGQAAGGNGKERGVFIGATGFGTEATATSAAAASNQAASAATGDTPLVIPQTGAVRPKSGPDTSGVAIPSTGATAVIPAAASAYDLLVTFQLGSAQLTPQARQNLDEFASALLSPELGIFKFAVDGHTDATGSESFNFALSERRAASVVDYLMSRGVAADRLIAKGYGESRPLRADPFDPVNRRVETRRLP